MLNGVSVVLSRFKKDGLVRPVVEGSEDAESEVTSSGSESVSESGPGSEVETETDDSVDRNRLMKGRRLRVNGLIVVLLAESKSEIEMTSLSAVSASGDVVDDAKDDSVLLNRFRNVGRFRVDPSDDGGVVNGTSVLRSRFSSACSGEIV